MGSCPVLIFTPNQSEMAELSLRWQRTKMAKAPTAPSSNAAPRSLSSGALPWNAKLAAAPSAAAVSGMVLPAQR
jgi:hypothetical protein